MDRPSTRGRDAATIKTPAMPGHRLAARAAKIGRSWEARCSTPLTRRGVALRIGIGLALSGTTFLVLELLAALCGP